MTKLDPTDPRRLSSGLVYYDESRATTPATHVLIVGVGAYKSKKFLNPLTTTTVSARAVADWFIEDGGFNNPKRPLGSVAVLLSEPIGEDKNGLSQYAGGEVPRANFANTENAVRDWVRRLNAHKDNLVFLYVASHGESFLGRTAFLLEDFGTDDLNETKGSSEVEQLVGALGNVIPTSQLLLFDCCRSPTDLQLPWEEDFGSKLISLKKPAGSYGEAAQQWVITATSLGEIALGRTNQTTLFADALLAALQGVASDPSIPLWPVRPGSLVDKIDRLMSLHRMPDERAQVPGGRLAGSFDITYPGEPADVPIYISLDDPAAWPDAVITVRQTPGTETTIVGQEAEPPFKMVRAAQLTALAVQVKREDTTFGSTEGKVYAPAIFMQVDRLATPPAQVIGHLDPSRSFGDAAQLVLSIAVQVNRIEAGAIAEIVRRDDPAKNKKIIAVPIGGSVTVDVSAGPLLISLRTPDGRLQARDCDIEKDQILAIEFTLSDSPHEWLTTAAMTGSIRPAPSPQEAPSIFPPPPPATGVRTFARDAFWRTRVIAKDHEETKDSRIYSNKFFHVEMSAEQVLVAGIDPLAMVVEANDDGRFVRLNIVDDALRRYDDVGNGLASPFFALVEGAGRRELVAVPTLGNWVTAEGRTWSPYVVVDRLTSFEQARCTVVVEDETWSGLLGFLASRDMEASGKLLESGLDKKARNAIQQKRVNPLAAVAGALVAVGSAQPDIAQRWDPWLYNLCKWFPAISDGPIILGKRLLSKATNDEQLQEARKWLLEGFKRGAPLYSLSADWLARGLEILPADDDELKYSQAAARRFANITDPTQAFTVVRFDN